MAKRLSRQQEIEALVKRTQLPDGSWGMLLPVNEDFSAPNEIDRERGVSLDAPEVTQSERAVGARTLRALVPLGQPQLRRWIFQMERSMGVERFYDALVDIEPIPERTTKLPKYARGSERTAYREAMKRSLQRAGPARNPGRKEGHNKAGVTKADYVARLRLVALQRAPFIVLAVYGLWRFENEATSEIDEHFSWAYTDPTMPDELETAREILARGGDGLIEYVRHIAETDRTLSPYPAELVRLHGVQVQVNTGRQD